MEYKKRNNAQSRVGQQLGNYRLLRLLGQGSFADVYLGEHMHLNTRASIKVLDMRLSNDDMGDFLLEARTIARLRHPNIVQILEFGVEGNTPYLVMDYAPNGTVRQRYPKGSILPLEIILPLLKQMTAALQHAHDEKIIHRDVKPENMLLGFNDELLLGDFGIAVVAHSSRTQSMRGVAGTVAYMAPEQLQGRPVFASDQYSLGVIMYEWLSGTRPFEGSFIDLVTQHTRAVPPLLHEKNPSISPALEKVVHRALAKDPQQRFASVQEFAAAVGAQFIAPQFMTPAPELFSTSTAPLPSLTSSAKISVLPLQETTMTIYRGHTAAVNAVAWAPNDLGEVRPHRSRIASASDDGTVQIWEATSGRKQATFRGHSGAVRAIAWSPDGKRIASASVDSTVQVWEAATMHRICSYNGHSGEVTAVAWSPDGKHIASASGDNTVQVWDASSGHRILVYRGHSQSVLTVAWCSNGQHIASAGDDLTVQVWQAATGNPVLTFRNHTHEILAVAWQPHEGNDQDSQYIASSGANQVVHIWEALSGNILFTYRGHQFTVSALAWQPPASDATTFPSPENTSPQHSPRIASASFDRTVHIWDATTGNNAVSYAGHANWVYAVAWAPGGQYIASASGDKTVQVWLAV